MIDKRGHQTLLFLFFSTAALFFLIPPLGLILFFFLVFHLFFFRDPKRRSPVTDSPLAPGDGKIVNISIERENFFLHEEAVRIDIFLSIFDVHITRSPIQGEIAYLHYLPGQFSNALHPDSADKNESHRIGIIAGKKKILVRQVSGAIARRIHWDIQMNQNVESGEKIGIICYGSRLVIHIPKKDFSPTVKVGQKVKGGLTLLGDWI